MKFGIILISVFLIACKGGSSPEPKKETPPPQKKEAIHILVSYGQSNSAGRAKDIQNAPGVPQSWGYEWRANSKTAEHLAEPTRQDSLNEGSAWSAFAIRFHELTGEKVVIVNVGVDGKKISSLTPSGDDGSVAFNWIMESINHYENHNQYEIKSVSMVWLQGESDTSNQTDLDSYFADLETIKAEFRSLHNLAEFYVVRVGYSVKHTCEQKRHGHILGNKQINKSEKPISNLPVYFMSEGAMSDNIHYSQDAYNRLGVNIADNLVYYLNGTDVSQTLKSESTPDFRC